MSLDSTNARKQLLRLQWATFVELQEIVEGHATQQSKEFQDYKHRYEREVRKYSRLINKTELLQKACDCAVIYCGDFHTLFQSQRTALHILEAIVECRKDIHLGLEFVSQKGEKWANDFVRRRCSEDDFLHAIEYDARWGFSWESYRRFFVFARQHNIRIVALNSDQGDQLSLQERDRFAAGKILDHTIRYPEILLFCLYGDLHVATARIPAFVQQGLKTNKIRRKTLTVFQNSEAMYWTLAQHGLESQVDVVEVSKNRYCVLSVAPWIKMQSYVSWLEDQSERVDDQEISPDYYHQILDLAQKIARFLHLKPVNLEQFSVCTAEDTKVIDELEDFLSHLDRHPFPIRDLIRTEMVENQSCYLTPRSVVYLSHLSLNRASEKAGQLMFSKLNPQFSVFGANLDGQDIFYRLLCWEAIGFLGSKIINPKRKCDRYPDFEKQASGFGEERLRRRRREERQVARRVLKHYAYETNRRKGVGQRNLPKSISSLPVRIFFRTAKSLGRVMADRLFYSLLGNRISIQDIHHLFLGWGDLSEGAQERYFTLATLMGDEPREQSSKEEHF